MGYRGRLFITRDNYPYFKQKITDLIEVGYQIENIVVDKMEFKDYEAFENHLFDIKKAYRIKLRLRKNDNTISYKNQWYDKRKWNMYEDIENEYDVYEEDMRKINLKYNEFQKPLFKYALFRDAPGYDSFVSATLFGLSFLISYFLLGAHQVLSLFISGFVVLFFHTGVPFLPVYKNISKKDNSKILSSKI